MSILRSTLAPAVNYVGRPEEIAELRAHLERAAAGRGSVVLLTGEPGVGKTRTCEQLATDAQRLAMIVAWGRCWEGRGATPYWPWVQLLRSLLVSVPSERLAEWRPEHSATVAALLPEKRQAHARERPPDSPEERFQLFQGVVEILRWAAGSAPLLLLLDDLQGADDSSLLLLDFVARDIAAAPILVAAAYREVATTADAPLAMRLPDLTREPAVCSVRLRRLDATEVESFVEDTLRKPMAAATIATLHRLTEGNPLFLLEYLRALGSDANVEDLAKGGTPLPAGVRNAVRRHLARLSDGCREILRAASVFGREFGVVTLRDLLGYPDEVALTTRLDEAVDVEILVTDNAIPGRYRFAYGLVRDALYGELSSVDLLRFHHDAGTTLASRAGAEANLAQIAHHFVAAARRGANPEPAVAWTRRAGDRAFKHFDYDEADRLYGLGIDVLTYFGPDDRHLHAELLLARGNTCNRLGEIERAKQNFNQAAELARVLGSRELLARAALGYGGPLMFPEGGYVDAPYVALLESALAQWNGDAHALQSQLLSRLATALYFTEQTERRRELCRQALKMARDCGDAEALGHVLLSVHAALWGPNAEERLALADELLRLISRTGDRSLAFAAHHWRYCDLLELGDVGGMENEFQACRALAQELREPAMLGWVDMFRAGRAMWQGRFEECERLANDNLAAARWLGNAAQTISFLQIYHLRALQGRCDEMLEPMRMVAALNPAIPAFAIGLAHIHAEAGRLDESRPLAAAVVAHLDHYPTDVNYISTLTCLGLVCARIGDAALTAPVYELMRPYEKLSIMIGTGLGYCGSAAHWLGVMAASLRRFDDAASHFDHALAAETAMGAPPWIANTQYEYAAMLVARGAAADGERAASLLDEALRTAEQLGMAGLSAKACELREDIGKPIAPATATTAETAAGGNAAAVFRLEGDFWTIEHEGRTSRLRDSRGLHYIAQLLRHPHVEFLVLDLAAEGLAAPATSSARSNVHHCEPVADRQAVAQYKQRLDEVRFELAEAENNNDLGRVAGLRREMEMLASQLADSVGFRGRQRPVSSDLERARSAVTKRIRDALRKVLEDNPNLGRHLIRSIQTGYFCSYSPSALEPVRWSF